MPNALNREGNKEQPMRLLAVSDIRAFGLSAFLPGGLVIWLQVLHIVRFLNKKWNDASLKTCSSLAVPLKIREYQYDHPKNDKLK
jgi:hypothetical protein